MSITRHLILTGLLALLAACGSDPGAGAGAGGAFRSADGGSLGGESLRELERGQASWYGERFQGRPTASGERFDMNRLTAAHPTLPFDTVVRVRSLQTGREVVVRINDRGPFTKGRVIDLSRAAAQALGMLAAGIQDVVVFVPESLAH